MRGAAKPFSYKLRPRPPKQPLNRIAGTSEDERLTGFVHGKEASDLEERFARALGGAGKDYIFEYEVVGPTTIPGQENQIDFIVDDIYPVEVDGQFTHKSGAQKAHDQLRDAVLNEHLKQYGWNPIDRISGDKLETQEQADQIVREKF
jgi:hypothetical protein